MNGFGERWDYDVRWDHENLEGIVDKKSGHCFHFVEVFKAFCRGAEIPVREVYGMRLTEEDGLEEDLIGIRQDFANRFKWAEVYFPEYGWIEVEPTLQADPFSIPAIFVQCNGRIFNQMLEVIGKTDGGDRVRMPLWRYDRTQWKPVYLQSNTILYSEDRHRVVEVSEEEMDAKGDASEQVLFDEREWTDEAGRRMVAALQKFADDGKRVLVFRRSDGRGFEFPVERLSEADRAFLSNALDGECERLTFLGREGAGECDEEDGDCSESHWMRVEAFFLVELGGECGWTGLEWAYEDGSSSFPGGCGRCFLGISPRGRGGCHQTGDVYQFRWEAGL